VKSFGSAGALADRCAELGIDLPLDGDVAPAPGGPLAQPLAIAPGVTVGNRLCVLPMEGWDATADGRPTDLVERRWERFGESGAKLVWGGEAVAVRADGRANPNQLVLADDSYVDALGSLRAGLVAAHERATGATHDLLVGLQLTHSGRFARPHGDPAPVLAYRHPVLDRRLPDGVVPHVLSSGEVDDLASGVVAAAGRAATAGFGFVDLKACHGYLGHELLTACGEDGELRPFEERTRLLRLAIDGVSAAHPALLLGVRLSVFDLLPWRSGPGQVGEPEPWPAGEPYLCAFGGDGTGLGVDLQPAIELVRWLQGRGVRLLCVTAGSPYYNPHIQRPAYFPPSDGYLPPEDPLVGVARLLAAAAAVKAAVPEMVVVGSGFSYLQEWFAHAGQAAVRLGHADSVGLGRMMLSYPEATADVLAGRPLDRRLLCRTFSDCTTAPRHGMVSGCYPLDPFYKARPERPRLAEVKAALRAARRPDPPA
jgi:2,4-dienoyl-CoA reductase-like NADH-dependent reductase (Old Yellow Enzyme family)